MGTNPNFQILPAALNSQKKDALHFAPAAPTDQAREHGG
jgi:hypothetical protein